jgi:DNA-binding NarL/FixJ family response regulator
VPKSFLIIDDNDILLNLTELLIKKKYGDVIVSRASNGKEALEKIDRLDYTVIITDLDMEDINGEELYRRLKNEKPHLVKRVALISAYCDTPKASYLLQQGCPYLTKPYNVKEFWNFIDSIISPEDEAFVGNHGYERVRNHSRFKANEKCSVTPVRSEDIDCKPIPAETIDYSDGGIKLIYEGSSIPVGIEVMISASRLDITNKTGKVVWSNPHSGGFMAGLQWNIEGQSPRL